jgi:hypothetical protein
MVQRLFAEFGDAGKVVETVKADVSLSARQTSLWNDLHQYAHLPV